MHLRHGKLQQSRRPPTSAKRTNCQLLKPDHHPCASNCSDAMKAAATSEAFRIAGPKDHHRCCVNTAPPHLELRRCINGALALLEVNRSPRHATTSELRLVVDKGPRSRCPSRNRSTHHRGYSRSCNLDICTSLLKPVCKSRGSSFLVHLVQGCMALRRLRSVHQLLSASNPNILDLAIQVTETIASFSLHILFGTGFLDQLVCLVREPQR